MPFREWHRRLRSVFSSSHILSETLRALKTTGQTQNIDPIYLEIRLSTLLGNCVLDAWRRANFRRDQQLLATASRIAKTITQVREEATLSPMTYYPHMPFTVNRVSEKLRIAIDEYLEMFNEEIGRWLPGIASTPKEKDHQALARLCIFVQHLLGRRHIPFETVKQLLNAALETAGSNNSLTADAIRKRAFRFRRDHADKWDYLTGEVRDADIWRPTFRPTKSAFLLLLT